MDQAPVSESPLTASGTAGDHPGVGPVAMTISISAVVVGLVLLLAMIDFDINHIIGLDAGGGNICGPIGAQAAHAVIGSWGLAGFLLPLLLISGGASFLLRRWRGCIWYRLSGLAILLPSSAGLIHLPGEHMIGFGLTATWDQVHLQGIGGSVGYFLSGYVSESGHSGVAQQGILIGSLGAVGTAIILMAVVITAILLVQPSLGPWIMQLLRERSQKPAQVDGQPGPTTQPSQAAQPAPQQQLSDEPAADQPAEHAKAPAPSPMPSAAKQPRKHQDEQLSSPGRVRNKPARETDLPAALTQPTHLTASRKESDDDRRASDSGFYELQQQLRRHDPEAAASQLSHDTLLEKIRSRRRRHADRDDSDDAEVPVGPDQSVTEDNINEAISTRHQDSTEDGNSEADDSDNEVPVSELDNHHANTSAATKTPTQPNSMPATSPVSINQPPPVKPSTRAATSDDAGDYVLPPIDLLAKAPVQDRSAQQAEIQEVSRTIEYLYEQHKVPVEVVAASRGPTITMYELRMTNEAMRINKVRGFEHDLALRLGTEGIRIVAPLPNKTTIGVEVPNRLKTPVVMRDLVGEIDLNKMSLPVIIGRDVIGSPMVGDLARMPHLLIAGATGTGKSVALNAIITSILLFRSPQDCKFIMVDPKMVELAGYDEIPHLLTAPITEMTQAHAALEWACQTMDERFFALKTIGVRNLLEYNKLSAEDIDARLAKKGKTRDSIPNFTEQMPFIVIVVDEYADLMMVNKEVEKSLVRLTAKARACGIHVILATQRPSADVVTGLIKSNLPTRICCKVADRNNSRVVLDAVGGENLLGAGDMLYLAPGTSNLVRGQGVWVQDHEIDAVIDYARSQGVPEYDNNITSGVVALVDGSKSKDDKASRWTNDREFHTAVQILYRHNKTGADFLRRNMGVGYNKATQFLEWLEDLGFMTPNQGSKPRKFLKSWDDWIDELKANGVTWEVDDDIYHNPF